MGSNSRVVSAFVLSAVFHLQLLDVDGVVPSTENLQKTGFPDYPGGNFHSPGLRGRRSKEAMVFSRFESKRDSCLQKDCSRPATRRSGIALMVVMVVFIVLYMMVYHLSFYTIMEGKIARVRHGDLQGQDALYSVAQLVMAQLTEDLVQDLTEGSQEEAAGSAPAPGGEGGRGASRGGGGGEAGRFVALQTGQQGGAAAGGGGSYYDYLLEAIFNQQQL